MNENLTQDTELMPSRREALKMILSSLYLGIPDLAVRTEKQRSLSLKEMALAKGVSIGIPYNGSVLQDVQYVRQLELTATKLVSDYAFHWSHSTSLDNGEIVHDLAMLDYERDLARAQGKKIDLHHLIWGADYAVPDWLTDAAYLDPDLQSRFSQLSTLASERIKLIGERYAADLDSWVVLNEPFGVPFSQPPRASFWKDVLGELYPDFVMLLFAQAKLIAPEVPRILNDTLIEFTGDQNDELTYSLVRSLLEKNCPLDAVGFQMHDDARNYVLEGIDARCVRLGQNVRKYQALGLEVKVTEMDIRLDSLVDLPGLETQEQQFELQGQILAQVMSTLLAEGITDITYFSLDDRTSWLAAEYPLSHAGLFDRNGNAKPAYEAMVQSLQSV